MRYSWPDGQQCAVVLSFDFDAESGFLFREPGCYTFQMDGMSLLRLAGHLP